MTQDDTSHPIVLFDGVCNFCSGTVNFLIERDPEGHLRFASLQSEVGHALAARAGIDADDLDTLVLVEPDGRGRVRSTAALRITRYLRAPWPLLGVFLLVPPFLRDFVYRFVARRRYRWFGKSEVCRLPTAEDAARFIE